MDKSNESMSKVDDKDKDTKLWLLIVLCVIVLGIFALSWWFLPKYISDSAIRGQFGDQFGSVNALFSGLAFAGLLYTIFLQRKELAYQRDELTQTREELKGQKEQLEEQNKTFRIQRFENTFFKMMDLQQQIVQNLEIKTNYVFSEGKTQEKDVNGNIPEERQDFVLTGRNTFNFVFNRIRHKYPTHMVGRDSIVNGMREVLYNRGLWAYNKYSSVSYFDHYFRHFYRILKFVKQNGNWLSFEEQYNYTSMLRATLSPYEIVWLFYNGLSEIGKTKLKPLIEEYSMLKNLRPDLLSSCYESQNKFPLTPNNVTQLQSAGFSSTDFEFFLTDENQPDKYHLSAFYNKEEIDKGQEYLAKWREFCANNSIVID